MSVRFDNKDLQEIRSRGMTPDQVLAQLEQFKRGFPFARLDRPCTSGDGITVLRQNDLQALGDAFVPAVLSGRVMKFVPASGAATRMFKSLMAVRNEFPASAAQAPDDRPLPESHVWRDFQKFFENLKAYAFYDDLRSVMAREALTPEAEIASRHYMVILDYVLGAKGLDLSNLPKGLIPFHSYPAHSRTAFEEHLVEGALYTRDKDGCIRVHFTVSEEHKSLLLDHLDHVRAFHQGEGLTYKVTVSVQEPSTDTLAVDMNNKPLRDLEGRLVFRPGGHGALLHNLNRLQGDIIFIKNIDNVVTDRLKPDTVTYKKALGAVLVDVQTRIFGYLDRVAAKDIDASLIREVLEFMKCFLSLTPPEGLDSRSTDHILEWVVNHLNRPLRVCGMVKNEGEPGGGPFWVKLPDGSLTLQIVESSQVDMQSPQQRAIWESATHFNPVDLVCAVRDRSGKPFHLMEYRDPNTGFISVKSKDGKDLKALEHPGLWNGSMAHWNTVFVEVPITTFAPVKTILDLLRPEHQPG